MILIHPQCALAAVLCVSCYAANVVVAAPASTPADQQKALEILRQYRQPEDTDSLLRRLKKMLPEPGLEKQITAWIHDLGDDRYQIRQNAHENLAKAGLAARELLQGAVKSKDLEVRSRASRLLAEMDSEASVNRRHSLTYAALVLLRLRGVKQAVPLAWEIAGRTRENLIYDAASETIWTLARGQRVDADTVAQLRKKIAGGNIRVQTIAIVALELTQGAGAVPALLPFLSHESEQLRLAAARALVDRKPRDVASVLIGLLDAEDPSIVAAAKAMLEEMFQQKLVASADAGLSKMWRDWAKQHLKTAATTPLKLARLDLSIGTALIEETFTLVSKDASRGYGRFSYESGDNAGASVSNGVLRLAGDARETDQRLFITSDKVTGSRAWPRVVEVHAKLTGEEENSGGYHVGVSVGRLKALFHPGYSGGGFRIETTDDHDYIVNNTNLGFTPRSNEMHEIAMKVTRTAGGADVDVVVTQGGRGGVKFKGSYKFTSKQLGEYNRVGLERSGRQGGDALFDSVTIRLQK